MASSLQGGHWEATLFSPCYSFSWIKSCSIFSQSWQPLFIFLNDTWYPQAPSTPPPPPPPFSWRDTLRRACVGGGDEKWMSGVVEECVRGVRRQGYTSLSRQPHADCLQVFCRGVRFTFHLVGDRQSLTLMYFWTLCAIGGKPYEAVYKLSASEGLSAFLFHSAWRVFPFCF